jgi:hypothetical protein
MTHQPADFQLFLQDKSPFLDRHHGFALHERGTPHFSGEMRACWTGQQNGRDQVMLPEKTGDIGICLLTCGILGRDDRMSRIY